MAGNGIRGFGVATHVGVVTALAGALALPKDTAKSDLAGWVMVGRVLLTLDEFLTKE